MTIDEAKAAGLKRYFTGKPCLRGHVSERFASNTECCQCSLLRQQTTEITTYKAAYYKANHVEIAAKAAAYNKTNAKKNAMRQKAYHQANTEKEAARKAAWHQAHAKRIAAKKASYAKANPHLRNALEAKRRAAKLQATPSWADFEAIKAVYRLCADVTRLTGEKQHVDHIYPLISDEVCGLHVAANLQILSATDNIKKGNKLLPMYEMPKPAVE